MSEMRPTIPTAAKEGSQALLEKVREELERGMADGSVDGVRSIELVTTAVDQILIQLLESLDDTGEESLPSGTILALGGYGRCEMSPHSDIDLLFLVGKENDVTTQAAQEVILHALWDLGFKVGQATRTQKECLRLSARDAWSATAHADARLVLGDAKAANTLKKKSIEHIQRRSKSFLLDIVEHTTTRHRRFGDTVYHLEPNLKLGEGGLRDIQTARWAACAAFGTGDIDTLVKQEVIRPSSGTKILEGLQFLWLIRTALHLETQRKTDRLTFATQDGVAVRLHYGTHENPDTEALMQDLYVHMREVYGATQRLLDLSLLKAKVRPANDSRKRWGKRIAAGYQLRNGYLDLKSKGLCQTDPLSLVRIFGVASQGGYTIHPDTQEEILAHHEGVASLTEDSDAITEFWSVLTSPDDGRAILAMHDLKVLPTLIPEFGSVTGLFQRNLFHAYTVDIHSLHGVCALKRLARGDETEDHPDAAELFQRCPNVKTLYLAMLLHDIGKGRGGGHCEKGATIAHGAALRLGLSESEAEEVAFLVQHHLDMALVSQQRDLSDSNLIHDFAQKLTSEERLTQLTLLTFADMSSVNPEHLSDWREVLLLELYRACRTSLTSPLEPREPDEIRKEVLHLIGNMEQSDNTNLDAQAVMLDSMPNNYLLSTPATMIAKHLQMVTRYLDGDSLVIDVDRQDKLGIVEMTVVCDDTPGLLARIAGVFAANGLDILSADVVSTKDTLVVDVFRIPDPHGVLLEEERRWAQIREQIATALKEPSQPRIRLEKTRSEHLIQERILPPVVPQVKIDLDASQSHTVIDVVFQDRLGLLFDIARVMYYLDLEITLSRVTTKGNEAHDTFYVQDREHRKITDPDKLAELRSSLLEQIP